MIMTTWRQGWWAVDWIWYGLLVISHWRVVNCDLMTPIISREYYEMRSTLEKNLLYNAFVENTFSIGKKSKKKKQEIQETFAAYRPCLPHQRHNDLRAICFCQNKCSNNWNKLEKAGWELSPFYFNLSRNC